MARFLGVSAYGTWAVWLSVTTLATYLTDAGSGLLGPLLVLKNEEGTKERILGIQSNRWSLAILASLLVLAMAFITQQKEYFYAIPAILIQPLNIEWLARAKQKFEWIWWRQMAQAVLFAVVVSFLAFCQLSVFQLLVLVTLVFAINHGSLHYLLKPGFRILLFGQAKQEKGQSFVFLSFLLYNFFYHWPILLGSFFCGKGEIGSYNAYFLFYAFAATLTLIAQDLYLADPDKNRQKFQIHLFVLALLGLALLFVGSRWVIPQVMQIKTAKAHQFLGLFSCVFLLHILRLGILHELYRAGNESLFFKIHLVQLLVLGLGSLCCYGFWEATMLNLGWALVLTESTGVILGVIFRIPEHG